MSRALMAAIAASVFLVAPMAPHAQARKRVLAWADVRNGYQHDSISHAVATIERLGHESRAYDTFIRTDSQLTTKRPITFPAGTGIASGEEFNVHNLNDFDAIFFFGGRFDEHPWGITDGTVVVDDPKFPAMRHLPPRAVFHDELYQIKDFSRDDIHVLAHLDASQLDLTRPLVHRKDGDFPAAWSKTYGSGRVFYSILGHGAEDWDNPLLQQMYFQAIRWSLRQVE